jgi:energy-coupling factor transporter ATP-binding protein EcfA2
MSHPLSLHAAPERQSEPSDYKLPPSQLDVPHTDRKTFIHKFGHDYGPGQHVTLIGPTQRGKTTLALQLLKECISPEHKAVLLAGKPPGRDGTMNAAAKGLNLRVISEWPPSPNFNPAHRDRDMNGYVLRPAQGMKDLDADNANITRQFRKAIMANYGSRIPVITVADEAHHVQKDLGLQKECEASLMRGAPHNAMWSLVQRGRYVSYLIYDAPEHMFIFFDPDLANQKRYSEIGGVNPKLLVELTKSLRTYRTKTGQTISECLYIRRSGPEIEIVGVT